MAATDAVKFALVCRIAVITTVILALIDLSLNIVMMCFHTCAIEVAFPAKDALTYSFDFFFLFYANYLGDTSCKYTYPYQDLNVLPFYAECNVTTGNTFGISYDPPFAATSADGAFIWVIVLLVLDVLWIVSAVVMEFDFGGRGSTSKKIMFWPWVGVTSTVLLYGLVAAIVFLCDLQYSVGLDCATRPDEKEFVDSWMTSMFVFPMFFFRGVLVWIAILILVLKVSIDGSKLGKQQTKNLYTPKKTLDEMVRETEEEMEEPQIKNPHAAAPEKPAEDTVDALPTIVPIRGMPPIQQAEERRLSHNMAYANEAFVPDPVPVQRVPSSVYSKPPGRRNYDSDFSDAETHKIGRPTKQPLDDRDEYAIPRARVDSYAYHAPAASRNSGRKAIMTPSGQSVRASDYLKDYRYEADPAPKPKPREDRYNQPYYGGDGGNRYMVKLKD